MRPFGEPERNRMHATTIVAVRHDGVTAIAGDGQVTQEHLIMKSSARKIRRLYGGRVVAGFAGSVADALTLFEKFEGRLEEYHGQLLRAAVELAKEWRSDRILRRLEALLLVADRDHMLLLSGGGEVIEPDDGVAAIGSGGAYALAAARALKRHGQNLTAQEIAQEAMRIAAEICIYTNENISMEALEGADEGQ